MEGVIAKYSCLKFGFFYSPIKKSKELHSGGDNGADPLGGFFARLSSNSLHFVFSLTRQFLIVIVANLQNCVF